VATGSEDSGTHSITSSTTARLTFREIAALAFAIIAVAASWFAFKSRVDTLEGSFNRHVADENAHFTPNFQRTHGEPVGTFDFKITIDRQDAIMARQDAQLEALQHRPFVLDGDTCRQVKGGTLCAQKAPP
jgi:hypothetical protein